VARPYIFEDHEAEQRRLGAQAQLYDPLTERVFRAAGLGAGMRVLDLGSGAGHVALLAGRLVGPEGHVVGVERDPQAVTNARERAAAVGVANVEFRVGDVQTLEAVDGTFDAVVGRLVLMYLPDPVEALRRAAGHVRPGGLVVAHEADLAYDWAAPQSALWSQVRGWFLQTLAAAHIEPRMGLRLYRCFVEAGLPGPRLTLEAAVVGGPEAFAWGWANVVRGVVPVMERLGVATAAEVDADTLADRLLADMLSEQGIAIGPPMFGAWAQVRSDAAGRPPVSP
jgi:ubiquinone/menaquinone biosynthesis C-methylase UbiE